MAHPLLDFPNNLDDASPLALPQKNSDQKQLG